MLFLRLFPQNIPCVYQPSLKKMVAPQSCPLHGEICQNPIGSLLFFQHFNLKMKLQLPTYLTQKFVMCHLFHSFFSLPTSMRLGGGAFGFYLCLECDYLIEQLADTLLAYHKFWNLFIVDVVLWILEAVWFNSCAVNYKSYCVLTISNLFQQRKEIRANRMLISILFLFSVR